MHPSFSGLLVTCTKAYNKEVTKQIARNNTYML